FTQTGTARLSWSAPSYDIDLGYALAREQTDDATLSAYSGAGQLGARLGLGHGVDVRGFTQVADRRDDPQVMARRHLHIRCDARLFVELSNALGVAAGGSLLRNTSTVSELGYIKWTAFLGLVVAASR